LLLDPEQFRFPFPVMIPREGSSMPPRGLRSEMPSEGP